MPADSEHLVQRIREKDSDALVGFIGQNRGALLAFVHRQLGTRLQRKVEPDDILQELTMDAVRSLPDVDLSERNPFSWLCQMAERRIIDAHRRFFGTQKRNASREVQLGTPGEHSQPALINLLVNSITTPSQAFSRNARELKLLAALDTLPDEQRNALRMRYVESLPSKGIAQRLGKSDGAVRVMLTRSLKRLQSLLEQDK